MCLLKLLFMEKPSDSDYPWCRQAWSREGRRNRYNPVWAFYNSNHGLWLTILYFQFSNSIFFMFPSQLLFKHGDCSFIIAMSTPIHRRMTAWVVNWAYWTTYFFAPTGNKFDACCKNISPYPGDGEGEFYEIYRWVIKHIKNPFLVR